MNKFSIILFLFVTSVIGEVNVALTLKELLVGERGGITITSDEGTVDISSMPRVDNLNWGSLSSSNQISVVNRRRTSTYKVTIPFVCSEPGVYKIPGFVYKVNGTARTTSEFSVKVQKPQAIDNKLFSKTYINGLAKAPDSIFVGEQVQVVFKVYVAASTHNEGRLPVVEMADVQFRDYSSVNRNFSNVAQYGNADSELIKGNRFHVFTFVTEFTPLKVGKLKGKAFCNWSIISDRRRRTRDFFGRTVYHSVDYPLNLELPEFNVSALPELKPEEGTFIGLIGNWNCKVSLNKKTVQAGEAVNLLLKFSGTGNVDQINPPALEIDDFRFYDAEVKKNDDGSGEVSWVVVPLSEKSRFPELKFCTFDTLKKAYKTFVFKPELSVTPGRVNVSTMFISGEQDESISPLKEKLTAVDILFLKRKKAGAVHVDLERNVLWLLLPVLLAPFIAFLTLLKVRHHSRLDKNSDYRRQHDALRLRKDVIKSVKKSDEKALAGVILDEVVPWLNDVNGLAKGTSVSELVETLNDSELGEMLRTAEFNKYMSSDGKIDKDCFLKKISRFSCVLLLFFCGALNLSAESDAFTQGVAEFEKGHYQSAKEIFLKEYEQEKETGCADAAVLYNLGNCSASLDNYPEAIGWYEKARRLDPRNSDIMENLNFARRKVGLNDLNKKNGPAEMVTQLRDKLRPDEWLIVASIFWIVVIVSFTHCRLKRVNLSLTAVGAGVAILLCLAAYSFQKSGVYKSRSEAVVLTEADVYKLPLTDESYLAFSVEAGKYAQIVEEREIFCLVKVDEAEGWIEKKELMFVWE